MFLEAFLNKISNQLIGYDVAIKDDRNQILILPIGKYSFSFAVLLICWGIYFLSGFVFSIFSTTYKGLPRREKMFWNLAVLRGIYGSYGALSAFYCRFLDPHLKTHVTETRTEYSYILVLSNLGFFVFEMIAQIYFDVHFRTFSKALHLHHILSLVGFLTTTIEDKGHFFALSGFILEFSTPFSCICYCLIKSGLSDTFLWKANQLILIHIFHVRSIVEWLMMYDFYYYWDDFKKMSVFWYTNTFLGLFSLCIFLTPYWTYRKTEQFFNRKDWNAESGEQSGASKKSKKQS